MKYKLSVAISIALLSSFSVAHADDYPEQILAVDGLALSIMGVAGVLDNDTLGTIGGSAWLLASPLVHLEHGEKGAALKSAALRVGMAATAAIAVVTLTAATIKSDDDDTDRTVYWLSFAITATAILGASAIDAAFLATHDSSDPLQAGFAITF